MPCAILPLDQFKENIRYWIFKENLSNIEIAHRISVRLDKPCSFRTIKNRLRDWGFNQRNYIKDSTKLRLCITVLFQQSYNNQNIV
jgi:hypothetical protein